MSKPPKLELFVVNRSGNKIPAKTGQRGVLKPTDFADWMRRRLKKVAAMQGVAGGVWFVFAVPDVAMKYVHERSMNDKTSTDVLTFDQRQPAGGPWLPGGLIKLETLICADEARRQARRRGHPISHELLLYAIHSLLHVTGYDDRTGVAAAEMHRREDELLVALGIGPVYDAGKGS